MRTSVILAAIIMILSTGICQIRVIDPFDMADSYETRAGDHEPIRIDSDSDLESQAVSNGWPGSGTESDPYIIENYTIDGTGHGCCIHVGNTTKHFVIRNCKFFNASYPYPFYAGVNSKYYGENGINFWDVENGTLENVSSSNNLGYGAWLHLDNGLILNSSFHENNMSGLWIAGSKCNISRNEFHNNSFIGVTVNKMVNGVFFHNDILFNSDDGLYMDYMTDGNTITDNYFRGNEKFDIVFSASINNHLRHNDMSKGFTVINNDKKSWLTLDIDGSNLLNGIPIRVYKNDMPSGIDLSSPMIYFINITGIDLDDYEASGTISSLRMIFCNEVTIDGSIFRGSAGEGLYTYYCQNVSIRNCTSYDNKVGFLIGGTFSVLVDNCTTYDNSETGISAGVNGVQDSIIISNNHVHGNGGSGLEVSQISMNATCKVIGNVIEDNNGGLMYSSSKGGYSQDSPGSDIIQDNVIRNNPGSGLSLSLKHSHYLTRIEGNHIAGNGAGISIADSSGGGTIIEDNKVLKNNGTGIFGVLSNNYVNVSGEPIACGNFDNTIEGNDGYGVFFVCSSKGGIPLENNVISNNSRTGVMFSAMSNGGPNRMVGNRIEGNGGVGIEMRSQRNAGYNPIEDNIIRYNKGWNGDYNEERDEEQMIGGILIISDISSGYPVRNNTITDNNGTGVHFVSSKSGSGNISGNDISRNLGDGVNIFVSSAVDRKIIDNRITGNRDSGIEFGDGINGYDVFDNTMSGNREGILLNGCNNISIERNIFTGNGIGILSEWGNNATIRSNLFSDNEEYGVRIRNGNHSTIWENSFLRNNGANDTYNEENRQACDNGIGNMWHTGTTGNYWDDWRNVSDNPIRTDPYPIACGAGSTDPYPLTDPPFGPFEADLTIDYPADGALLNTSNVTIEFTVLSNGALIDAVEGSLDGGIWQIIEDDGFWTLTGLGEGYHTATISVIEAGGRTVERSISFKVDTVAPMVMEYWPQGSGVNESVRIFVNFTEMMANVSFDFPVDGITSSQGTEWYYDAGSLVPGESYTVGVSGSDLAGNLVEFNWTFTVFKEGSEENLSVTGRIIDEDGNTLSGIEIEFSGDIGWLSGFSDENGNFSIDLPKGQYDYETVSEDHHPEEGSFTLVNEDLDLGDILLKEIDIEEESDDHWIYCLGILLLITIIGILIVIVLYFITRKKDQEGEE